MKKLCNRCFVEKDINDFSKNSHCTKDGHLNQCKKCVSKKAKEKYNDITKTLKQKRKERYYADREENIRKAIEWGRKNKEKRDIAKRKWREKNKELTNHLTRSYNYRRKKALGSHTLQEWLDLCKKHNNKCAYCKKDCKLTEDHIIPLSKGGSNNIENIQPLCVSCNSKKGNKL